MARKFQTLTPTVIRALAPKQKKTEHGITVERLRNNDLRWSVNFMIDGQRIHRVIGLESSGVNRTQCERFIGDKSGDARAERLSLPRGRKTHLAFEDAARKYISRLEETAGKNMEAKTRHVTRRLTPYFKKQRIDTLSKFTIDKYKNSRVKEGAEHGTINRELATLSHIFTMALEWKWLKDRPCKIQMYKEAEGRIIALSDTQCDDLMTAAIKDSDQDCWLFVAFGLNTAMRHSEILAVRFEEIDFENLRLRIPKAKAGARNQPITKELGDILASEKKMRPSDEWVFPSPRPTSSKTGHRHRMDKSFRRAATAAGLNPELITPHVMRHTAITNLVQAGIDLPTIQRIAGHKTLTMVLRYTHVHGTHINQAMEAIGRTIPERTEDKREKPITQELHMFPKKSV